MKSRKVYLDKKSYENLMDFMNLQQSTDQKGDSPDFNLFYKDEWLMNSAVIDNIVLRNGNWDIYLVFAHVDNPFKIIKKKITKCFSLQKAIFTANHMRRLAAKDQRGTLTVDPHSFKTWDN